MSEHQEAKGGWHGYLLVYKISKLVLAITTFAGGFAVAFTRFDGWYRWPIAFLGGFIVVMSIDKLLGALMDDLINPGSHPAIKWLLMVIWLAGTGGSTFVVGLFVAEQVSEGRSLDEKQAIRAQALADFENQKTSTEQQIDALRRDIRDITRKFQRDTAAIIAAWHPNHRKMYYAGRHNSYMLKKGYETLRTSVGRLDTRINEHLTVISEKQANLSRLESGLAVALTSDPLETVNTDLAAEDARNAKMAMIFKGMVYLFDIAAVLSLLISFLFIRSNKRKDKDLELDFGNTDKWILGRWRTLGQKLLETTDGADVALQTFFKSFFTLVGALFMLFGWLGDMITFLVLLPTRIGSPENKAGAKWVKGSSPDLSPAAGAQARSIGFHHYDDPGEKPVNTPPDLASEQVVNRVGEKPVKPGATQVSAGEPEQKEAPGELVKTSGEKLVKSPGENVVNVQVVNGEPTFAHWSEKDGEMKYYTRNEVKRWESKYRGHCREIEEWISKNQKKAPVDQVLKKNEQLEEKRRQHQYWAGALEAVEKRRHK